MSSSLQFPPAQLTNQRGVSNQDVEINQNPQNLKSSERR